MGSFKSGPLSTLLVIGLLAWITVVLIAPEIDLPDTAFERNCSLHAVHALTRHVVQRSAAIDAPRITFPPANASDLASEVYFFDCAAVVASAPPRILRC